MYFESSGFETEEAGIKQKQCEELSRTSPRLGSPPGRHREIYCLLALQAVLAPQKKEAESHKQVRTAAALHSFSVCKQYLWCVGVKLAKMA